MPNDFSPGHDVLRRMKEKVCIPKREGTRFICFPMDGIRSREFGNSTGSDSIQEGWEAVSPILRNRLVIVMDEIRYIVSQQGLRSCRDMKKFNNGRV